MPELGFCIQKLPLARHEENGKKDSGLLDAGMLGMLGFWDAGILGCWDTGVPGC